MHSVTACCVHKIIYNLVDCVGVRMNFDNIVEMCIPPKNWINSLPLSESLVSLGIMGAQLEAPLIPLNTIVL